jgi:pSer/pThr/pTyr-binding forkhead associated (FHA) protein
MAGAGSQELGQGSETIITSFDPPERGGEGRTARRVGIQGEDIGRRFLLNEDRRVLGRDAREASICVSDPAVSGRHARIELAREDGDYVLTDLGSRNGTFVNGMRVDIVALGAGDRIVAGETILKFDIPEPP